MDFDLFEKIIDEAEGHVHDVTVHHRGESLLHPDIFRMIEHASDCGLRTRLHTNATLLDEDKSARLLGSGLDFLSFSFRDVGKTIENMRGFLLTKRHLRARKPFTQIEILDIRPDAKRVKKELEREFRSLPLDRIVLKKPHNWAGAWRGLGTIEPKTPCLFPWFALVVLWNGDVLPCPQDFSGKLRLGNIRNESLEDIWRGRRLNDIRSLMKQRRFDGLDPCRKCDMLSRRSFLGIPWSSLTTAFDQVFPRRSKT